MTVFSAPDYPQFVADDAERSHNKAAVAVLSAPDYATPRMVQFEADLPRPEVGGWGPGGCACGHVCLRSCTSSPAMRVMAQRSFQLPWWSPTTCTGTQRTHRTYAL